MSNFTDLVKDEFVYLESENGFACSIEDKYSVKYENDKVILLFTYDSRLSYELNLFFDSKTARENRKQQNYFTLGDLLDFKGDTEFKELRAIQISNPDILKKFIERISFAIKQYGQEVLTGNSNFFNELEKEVSNKNQKYYAKMELESILSEAFEAWEKKDYRKYCEILTPHKDRLSEVDLKRLSFASKRL